MLLAIVPTRLIPVSPLRNPQPPACFRTMPRPSRPFKLLLIAVFLTVTQRLQPAAAASPTTCPLGHGVDPASTRPVCRACAPGTAADSRISPPICAPCPANTYTTRSAVVSTSLCLPCRPRTASSPNSTSCVPCRTGTVRTPCGNCLRCPPGTMFGLLDLDTAAVDGTASRKCRCSPCDAGSVSPRSNARFCTPCPDGQEPDATRTRCVRRNCAVGTFCQAASLDCVMCLGASVRPSSSASSSTLCTPCGPRHVVRKPGPKRVCRSCPAGSYVTNSVQPAWRFEDRECKKCPVGKTTRGTGKAYCRAAGATCPTGMFVDGDGDCESCPAGHFRDVGTGGGNKCRACRGGHASEGGVATSCVKCTGRYSNVSEDGRRCVCAAGYEAGRSGKCQPCKPGLHKPPFSELIDVCIPCPAHTFASRRAATACTPCPFQTSSAATHGRKCEPVPSCRAGYFVPDAARGLGDEEGGVLPDGGEMDSPIFPCYDVCVSVISGCPQGLRVVRRSGRLFCIDRSREIVCPKGYRLSSKLAVGCILENL